MREVICADALDWMAKNCSIGAVVTSLPDAEECGFDISDWSLWFVNAAVAAIRVSRPDCPAIFYQTDRKLSGRIISKSYLIQKAAEQVGANIVWHKIVLRRAVGKVDLFRPGFTHLICVSVSCKPGKSSPDVMDSGRMIYDNAMGLNAAVFSVRFAGGHSNLIVDPFCGRGTVLAVANAYGFDAIGVDIISEQCERAKVLKITRRE